jgi:hypothetical protein
VLKLLQEEADICVKKYFVTALKKAFPKPENLKIIVIKEFIGNIEKAQVKKCILLGGKNLSFSISFHFTFTF